MNGERKTEHTPRRTLNSHIRSALRCLALAGILAGPSTACSFFGERFASTSGSVPISRDVDLPAAPPVVPEKTVTPTMGTLSPEPLGFTKTHASHEGTQSDRERLIAIETLLNLEKIGIRTLGVPAEVDSRTVDVARGSFQNTIGQGTNATLAEPGVLLVGPDFGYTGKNNPRGENPNGWDTMYGARGYIKPFSPVSQEVARTQEPFFQNVPEGGFAVFVGGAMTVRVDRVLVEVEDKKDGIVTFLVIRGKYPAEDRKQNSYGNLTAKLTNYRPGHLLAMMYEAGDKNAAFISEGQFLQMAGEAHNGGTNCGTYGCSRVRLIYLDVNTRAFGVWEHDAVPAGTYADAITAAKTNWQVAYKNY